jgi:integrase
MPKSYPHSHIVDGSLVGFSVSRLYGDTYIACFRDKEGRRLKLDTKQGRIRQAIDAARILIEETLRTKTLPAHVKWDDAIERLKARLATSGNRESTLGYYLKLIRLATTISPAEGPASVTEQKAAAWRDKMMTTPGRRKKLPSAHYVAGLIAGLSALWQKWLIDDMKIIKDNPWRDVQPPKADKLPVKYATDEQIQHFYAWIAERFGGWPFPKLFLSVKAHTGCRLMDLCSLKSSQLRQGRLVFPASLTKGRKERAVPMPADLYSAIDAFKGKSWLWENYLPGLRIALETKGHPIHQMMEGFAPHRLYFWIENLFADYHKANLDRPRLTTHMFRKRAFTMAWQAGIDARRASIAYGCNVDTLMQHYVALDEQQVTDEVFARMNEKRVS